MPKKIKGVESRIMDSAKIIFRENGYVKSEIKQIASHSGVAVGTIYNYWPSKKKLFFDVSAE
ncbi:MAG TPA: TetR/AcrR family transcriptional regulator, partial [Clostridia bacterium]|nr:TetR/AcrR family transcriptional regulator [Clostridia bacterium]